MKKRIKSIKEFENTCIKCERGYTLSEDDIYLFPINVEEFIGILGRNVEAKQNGNYLDCKNRKNELYWIEEIECFVPWWYFSEKRIIEIE